MNNHTNKKFATATYGAMIAALFITTGGSLSYLLADGHAALGSASIGIATQHAAIKTQTISYGLFFGILGLFSFGAHHLKRRR